MAQRHGRTPVDSRSGPGDVDARNPGGWRIARGGARMAPEAPPSAADRGVDMRIAILGAGNVGGGLGRAFTAVGHDVVFGVRDPESTKTLAALADIPDAEAASPAAAVDGADIIVFALRPVAMTATVADLPSLDGRIVIDAMNRLGGDQATSTTQDLAAILPGAKLVKAFNTIGFENYATAAARTVPAAMFIAGDDPDAKRAAMALASEIGFRPEDAGGLVNAKVLEEMVRIWMALVQVHGRSVAFAISEG
jgi:predicted dinucleotide-binding enzyme